VAKEPKPKPDPKAKQEPEPVPVVEEVAQPRSYRLHILLGLVIIALAQTTVLFFLIPSREQIKRELYDMNKVLLPPDTYTVSTEVNPVPDLNREQLLEKPLGDKFKVQSIRQGPEQITDVFTITLVVQILKKDEAAYDKIFAERQNAIRDVVTVVLRGSSLDERNQISLATIRGKVKKAINDELGISYVKGVLCPESSVEMN
jgi:hypothetical protein